MLSKSDALVVIKEVIPENHRRRFVGLLCDSIMGTVTRRQTAPVQGIFGRYGEFRRVPLTDQDFIEWLALEELSMWWSHIRVLATYI